MDIQQLRASLARGLIGGLGCMIVAVPACASGPSKEASGKFAGAWQATWCDQANPTPDKCGRFDLYLTQEGDRICGGHYVATPGLSRIDEGEYDSVKGTYDGGTATVVITNSRNGSTHLATARLEGNRLRWKMIGMLSEGTTDEPAIIPLAQTLVRDESSEAMEMLGRVREAPCRWPDETKRPAD